MPSAQYLCGSYRGRKMVREGRRDELTPTERKEVDRGKSVSELSLRPDGTFQLEITSGTWKLVDGSRVKCAPATFGGQSLDEMRTRCIEMGRAFNLAFLFKPFDLKIVGDVLVTADDEALIYTEFCKAEV